MTYDLGSGASPYATPPRGADLAINTYMVPAILCLLFCGGFIAIPAIVYASKVSSRLSEGDVEGARRASAAAKMWVMISLGFGIFSFLGGVAAALVMVVLSIQGAA